MRQANPQETADTPHTKVPVMCGKGIAAAQLRLHYQGHAKSWQDCAAKSACVVCRGAYSQETREIILSLDRATKTAPNGKQILKNVGVGMYLGAKIGFLGQNGTQAITH